MRVSPPDVDQMLTQASRLARRAADERQRKLGQRRHCSIEIGGGNERDCRASECRNGIQRCAEEAARTPERVSGECDVEDLSPAIRQSAIAQRESLRQDEYAIVPTPLHDEMLAATQDAHARAEAR